MPGRPDRDQARSHARIMSNPNAYILAQYPSDKNYSVGMGQNFDLCVSAGTDDDVGVHLRSVDNPNYPFPCGALHLSKALARWLGLALLRATLEHQREQCLEVRAGKYPQGQLGS